MWGAPSGRTRLSAASKSTACDRVSAGLRRNVSSNRFLFLFFLSFCLSINLQRIGNKEREAIGSPSVWEVLSSGTAATVLLRQAPFLCPGALRRPPRAAWDSQSRGSLLSSAEGENLALASTVSQLLSQEPQSERRVLGKKVAGADHARRSIHFHVGELRLRRRLNPGGLSLPTH